jgi:hypothetical protein
MLGSVAKDSRLLPQQVNDKYALEKVTGTAAMADNMKALTNEMKQL